MNEDEWRRDLYKNVNDDKIVFDISIKYVEDSDSDLNVVMYLHGIGLSCKNTETEDIDANELETWGRNHELVIKNHRCHDCDDCNLIDNILRRRNA